MIFASIFKSFARKGFKTNKFEQQQNLSMEVKDLVKSQVEFDRRHGWDWSDASEEEKVEHLQYLAVALCGEIGEFANLVKKIARRFRSKGELPSQAEWKELKEELVDVFTYILKGAGELFKIDLEKEYLEKMKTNEERFKEFEKA